MATTAGDRTARRRGDGHPEPTTPADVGTALREAREASGLPLDEVRDRTGIPLLQLEGLEAGEMGRFPDQRAALTAVRRYSDLVGLDARHHAEVVREAWNGAAPVSAPPARGRRRKADRTAAPAGPVPSPHLSRYPDDGSHLRAFTTTAEVPGVQRAMVTAGTPHYTGAEFAVTGVFPAAGVWVASSPRVPLLLRIAIGTTVVLLVVALGGLAVDHWKPQWLTDIHVRHTTTTTLLTLPGSATTTTPGAGATSSGHGHARTQQPVTQTSLGNGSAAVSVRAATFTVVVAASGACWVQASTPQSVAPVFVQTLQSGQSAKLHSANGQLTVQLGSSYALVAVDINGKPAKGWLFKPPSAPFTINFTSSGTTATSS